MLKRKSPSRISTRYRRKLIREESDKLFALFNEEFGINTNIILNNFASSDHDEIVNCNHAIFDETEQSIINSSFSDLTNIINKTNITNISASGVLINNISLHREDNIRQDSNIREDNNSEKENNDFEAFLVQWACTHHISHVALSHLLTGLRTAHPTFSNFPKCAKTLLRTPRSSVITEIFPGQYCHLGVEYGILQFLSRNKNTVSSPIQIQIGIDGLPISKSSSNQLWPILGRIMPDDKVFLIGCYFGKTKPADANKFLQQFVDEISNLINNGITYNETTFSILIHSIICDAPAKSFITLTKGHTGYFSCPKCTIEGHYIANRICFPDFDYQARTDDSFSNQIQEEHHFGRSILLNIPHFGIVSHIPFDYMHMICIGVVKKLIKLWISGPFKTRCLSSNKIKSVSKSLLNIRHFIPKEFARRPREIQDFAQWKATELRQFLLYTGPVILQKELNSVIFSNFLTLHIAVRILCQKSTIEYIEYADKLLKHFVECFIKIYGPEFASHNIHGLLHITDCVKQFGPLDIFSAFPFENFMKELKSILRKSDKPLEQIRNRYAEMSFCKINSNNINVSKINVKAPHEKGPLISGCFSPQFSKIEFPHFIISVKSSDNCCLIENDIVCLENIATSSEGNYIAVGRKFKVVEELYNNPCSSVCFDIFKVSRLSTLQVWPLHKISKKFVKLPYAKNDNERNFAVIPLLSTAHL